MRSKPSGYILKILIIGIIFFVGVMPLVFADIYINVMAVNGTDDPKNSPVKFNLPGELTAQDIVDTSGLQLDYSVNDANFYVHGDVALKPKESKTFRIQVRDVWKITPQQVIELKKQVDEGFERLGKVKDPQKAEVLRSQLFKKLDYIVERQSVNADSIEARIDSYRSYAKELKRIQNNALGVEYWRSDPSEQAQAKIIRMQLEVENPVKNGTKLYKHKHYLPEEVRPEHVVEAEGFEVRFDQQKKTAFLFKEEELTPGEKKKYSIGILDVWFIAKKEIDYLRERTATAFEVLRETRFEISAKSLVDRITLGLSNIEASQVIVRASIDEHISAYRDNKNAFADVQRDVETLEKLVSVYREDLEKSKVDNVLKKIKSLKSVSDVSKAVLSNNLGNNTAWGFIRWILLFVGVVTLLNFIVWVLRSKDKKLKEENSASSVDAPKSESKK